MGNFYDIPSDQTLINTSGTTQYVGTASSGAAEAEAKWSILRVISDANSNPLSVKFAGGNKTRDKIWTDRTTLTYL